MRTEDIYVTCHDTYANTTSKSNMLTYEYQIANISCFCVGTGWYTLLFFAIEPWVSGFAEV